MINARTAVENTNSVVLYPNPPEWGEVNLLMQQVGDYRVEVRDSRGNLRYTREMKQLDKVTIDVADYSAGLYLVTIFNGKE